VNGTHPKEEHFMRRIAALGLAALVAVVALVVAMPAAAGGGGKEIIRTGNCSGSADWKLKAKHDDGRIETEFEVDSNRNGQRWQVTLKRDGVRFFRGVRVTHAPSGSFEVERRPANPAGPDRITARAVNLASGQVCQAALTI
jgi:hypothetical protein